MREQRYVLFDDLDGSEAVGTVSFAVGRQAYEIELNQVHMDEFNRDMEKWTQHARKVSGRFNRHSQQTGPRVSAEKVRVWAAENGIQLSERGRIPLSIRDRYMREHGIK